MWTIAGEVKSWADERVYEWAKEWIIEALKQLVMQPAHLRSELSTTCKK